MKPFGIHPKAFHFKTFFFLLNIGYISKPQEKKLFVLFYLVIHT